jgi:glucokinase
MPKEVLGIDAGGTWIKAGLFDAQGDLVRDVRVPSGAAEGREAYGESVAEALARLEAPAGVPAGLSLPALLTPDRKSIRVMANVKGLENLEEPVPVADLFGGVLGGREAAVENDAGCAALGEWRAGGADIGKRLLVVTWGTGIGTGLVADGQAQYGWEGGHIPVNPYEPGDLEARAAVPAIVKRIRGEWEQRRGETRLTDQDLADGKEASRVVLRLAQEGDALCRQAVTDAVEWLVWGLRNWTVVACPDEVVIGGAFMANDWLLDLIKGVIAEKGEGFWSKTLDAGMVRAAGLGNKAGMAGAAWLAGGAGR